MTFIYHGIYYLGIFVQILNKMDRKKFIQQSLLTLGSTYIGTKVLGSSLDSKSTYSRLIEGIGYNHIPNKEEKKMNTLIHRANTRGYANHGWLKSYHTFSFANYRHPERMNFGVLRVLNDDYVESGKGFGTHPHDNMEIITIPLEGALEHKDSMGNSGIISTNEIQVMSAGTGVYHSEYNANKERPVKFLQIWMFPNKRQVEPRYDQLKLNPVDRVNQFQQILSPNPTDAGVWAHQNAWFYLGKFDADTLTSYTLNDGTNGVYVFVINGEVVVNNETLQARDGMGIWDTTELHLQINQSAELLVMEVPMKI